MRVELVVSKNSNRLPRTLFAPARVATLISADALPPNSAAILRLLNLEFLDRIDRRVDDEIVEQLVGHLHAVEQVDVVT